MRTKNSLKNILTTLIPYAIIGILGFAKVRVFVSGLGDDLYSLNQLFFQILGYVALADIGFNALVTQKLYKAFATDNKTEVNKLYSTFKIYFRVVGLIIIAISIIVSFFVHYLTKVNISPTYIQIVFIAFVLNNSVDYFMSCPRYVIEADQKKYKINLLINAIRIIEIITEIIFVKLGFDYLIVLLPGIFIKIIFNLIINKIVFKEYPWLINTKKYVKSYTKGMGDVLGQKLSGLFYNNVDIILISTFLKANSAIGVVIYSSYNYIIKYITDVLYMVASAITPSYANIANSNDRAKDFTVFSELNIIFYYIASFFTIMVYIMINPLIVLWIGQKYLLSTLGLILFVVILNRSVSNRMMFITINSKGLFKETRNIMIAEAILNLLISFILVFDYGIIGVLIGTILSTSLTVYWYLPKYMYNKVFNRKSFMYFVKDIVCFAIPFVLIFIMHFIKVVSIDNVWKWVEYGFIYSLIFGSVLFILYYTMFKSFRNVISRFKYLMVKK